MNSWKKIDLVTLKVNVDKMFVKHFSGVIFLY
jgi:hypothetical protein